MNRWYERLAEPFRSQWLEKKNHYYEQLKLVRAQQLARQGDPDALAAVAEWAEKGLAAFEREPQVADPGMLPLVKLVEEESRTWAEHRPMPLWCHPSIWVRLLADARIGEDGGVLVDFDGIEVELLDNAHADLDQIELAFHTHYLAGPSLARIPDGWRLYDQLRLSGLDEVEARTAAADALEGPRPAVTWAKELLGENLAQGLEQAITAKRHSLHNATHWAEAYRSADVGQAETNIKATRLYERLAQKLQEEIAEMEKAPDGGSFSVEAARRALDSWAESYQGSEDENLPVLLLRPGPWALMAGAYGKEANEQEDALIETSAGTIVLTRNFEIAEDALMWENADGWQRLLANIGPADLNEEEQAIYQKLRHDRLSPNQAALSAKDTRRIPAPTRRDVGPGRTH